MYAFSMMSYALPTSAETFESALILARSAASSSVFFWTCASSDSAVDQP